MYIAICDAMGCLSACASVRLSLLRLNTRSETTRHFHVAQCPRLKEPIIKLLTQINYILNFTVPNLPVSFIVTDRQPVHCSVSMCNIPCWRSRPFTLLTTNRLQETSGKEASGKASRSVSASLSDDKRQSGRSMPESGNLAIGKRQAGSDKESRNKCQESNAVNSVVFKFKMWIANFLSSNF